jgi:hypothetical protein
MMINQAKDALMYFKWLFAVLLLCGWSALAQPQLQPTVATGELSKAEIQVIIRNIADELQHHYVEPATGKTVSAQLLAKLALGEFDGYTDISYLQHQLTHWLVQSTRDPSLSLVEQDDAALLTEPSKLLAAAALQHDAVKAEISAHNIGYLQLRGQFNFPDNAAMLAQQLHFLAGVDALIIDLQQADSGKLVLVQQLLSYFVPPGTELARVHFNQHTETLIAAPVPAVARFKPQLPLYIVTSAFVAGGWELFADTLQRRQQAVVVGETTMGIHQLETMVKVSDKLSLQYSHGAIALPQAAASWAEQGVVPDYFFAAKDAVAKAYALAVAEVKASSNCSGCIIKAQPLMP